MQKGIRNARLMNRELLRFATNSPHDEDTAKQYYANETKAFYMQNIKWSSNLVHAMMQGVDYRDFYAFRPVRIRTAAVINPTTGNNLSADWQHIIVEDANIDFIPRGAKVVFNGSTWIVLNPDNIASVTGTGIMKRCNATWHHLDFWGNVLAEPFCYGAGAGDLNTGDDVRTDRRSAGAMLIMQGYQHCIMQYGPETMELAHNRRMILGTSAYSVRDVQNFAQEFSSELDSNHLQYFDMQIQETLDALDDLPNRVADGKSFSWEIKLEAPETMLVGETHKLVPKSYRNGTLIPNGESDGILYTMLTVGKNGVAEWGYAVPYTGSEPGEIDPSGTLPVETPDGVKEPELYLTEDGQVIAKDSIYIRSVTYDYRSSAPSVATVDEEGNVTAVAEGSCSITCTLKENPKIHQTYSLNVVAAEGELQWVIQPPAKLNAYHEATFSVNSEDAVFTFTGASEDCYEATVNGNTVTLKCWQMDKVPLTVTAYNGTESIRTEIRLAGW